MRSKVIIIGAGIAGLAAGCRLAARGYPVEIHEKLDKPGGKAYPYQVNGFTFACGPSIVSAPHLLDEIFTTAGRRREDYLSLIPVNPFYRVFGPHGNFIDVNNDDLFLMDQLSEFDQNSRREYARFKEKILSIYDQGLQSWFTTPSRHFEFLSRIASNFFGGKTVSSARSVVSRYIHNESLQDVLAFHPLRLGENPFEAPSSALMNHYFEKKWGVWHAVGGPTAIVNGLTGLLVDLGGEIHLNSEVAEILISGRRTNGIRLLDGRLQQADVIIAAFDPASMYTRLIRPANRNVNSNTRYEKAHYSNSVFSISFGTRKRFTNTNLLPHNFIFESHLENICNDIFQNKIIPKNLFLHLILPTYLDPTIAPEGCDTIQVVAAVPNLESETDWSILAISLRDRILQFLEEKHLPGLKAAIIAEHHMDPTDIHTLFSTCRGSAFSMHFNRGPQGWSHPRHRSEDIENLYLVGDGTHPGPGLPGVLTSAWTVTRLIERENETHQR